MHSGVFNVMACLLAVLSVLSACAPTLPAVVPISAMAAAASTAIPSTAVPTTTTEPPATAAPVATFTPAAISAPSNPPTPLAATLIPSPLPYPPAVVKVEMAEVWDDPAHEKDNTYRQTQLILGEKVFILQTRGEWNEIAAVEQPSHKYTLGYPGWVRANCLTAGWPRSELWLVVMAPVVEILARPDSSAAPLLRAPLDARLPVLQQAPGWVEARLPDGRSGWLPTTGLRLTHNLAEIVQATALLDTARRLVGIPYIWGGTAPGGLDCSGFIYRVYHAHGILLPRDADDQARLGRPVEEADLQPGDLLFYATQPGGPVTHVAMFIGEHMVLDASLTIGLTRHYVQEMNRARSFVGARRMLEAETPGR